MVTTSIVGVFLFLASPRLFSFFPSRHRPRYRCVYIENEGLGGTQDDDGYKKKHSKSIHNHNDLCQLTNNRRIVQLLQWQFVQLHPVVELAFEVLLDGEHNCKSKIQSDLNDKRIKNKKRV